jgi:hypothetical protein
LGYWKGIFFMAILGYLNAERKSRGVKILRSLNPIDFKEIPLICKRSLSPVIKKFALAAKQASRIILSSSSRQIEIDLGG